MPEEFFTQRESIAIIESMINKARNRFSENGFLYLLWGWVILVCSLGDYFLQYVIYYSRHYLVWTLTWVALLVQFLYIYRERKKRQVNTYTEDIIRYVWIAFVILLFLFLFIAGQRLGNGAEHINNVLILAVYGMPTFLSGIILRFRPLIAGGIACWMLSLAASFMPDRYHLLLVAAGVIIAWIIPGYLLRFKYKKENR